MTSGRGLIPTTEEVLQNAGAFGAHLGFGSIAGYAAGKAMRAGTNIGLVLAGAGFITAQMLQQRGYIQVDWNKVENEVRAVLDVDGDGEISFPEFRMMMRATERAKEASAKLEKTMGLWFKVRDHHESRTSALLRCPL